MKKSAVDLVGLEGALREAAQHLSPERRLARLDVRQNLDSHEFHDVMPLMWI